jgi:diguanylate cyclase (GGDEF)-like protein/PAS domain S-box-containing protein
VGRKTADAASAEGAEKFRLLFENSPDPIVLLDGGTYVDCNEAALAMMGCKRKDELIGLTPWALAPERQPDGRPTQEVARERIGETLRYGRNRFEFLRNTVDGREILIEVTQTVVPIGGREILYTVWRDITERKKAEVRLQESEGKFRDLVEKSLVGVYLIQDGVFKYVNARLAEIYESSAEELINLKGPKDTVHQDDLPMVEENIRKRLSGEVDSIHFTFRILLKSGEVRHIEAHGSRTLYMGRPAVIGSLQDITERKSRDEELRWRKTFLQAMVRSSDDGVLIVDTHRGKVVENQRMIDMWKIPQSIVENGDEEEKIEYVMSAIKDPGRFYDMIVRVYNHPEETVRGEFELKEGTVVDAGSHPVLGMDGKQYGRIWKFRDITEMRRYWDMLEALSATDGLTGLSNRRHFDEFLDREWRRGIRQRSPISLILVDIDYFKEFNDCYGHQAGDECLQRVAGVLLKAVRRAGDLAARYGGEEFACILSDTDPEGALPLARTIMEEIGKLAIPHAHSPVADLISVSCGVATLVPQKEQMSSELVRIADGLLYAAKEEGRNRLKSWPFGKEALRAGGIEDGLASWEDGVDFTECGLA